MKLRLIDDPVLREVCTPVDQSEMEYILSLIPDMTNILLEEKGAALAANQVGITKRFFLLKLENDLDLIINPEITEIGNLEKFEEGCLSIPGASAETSRALQIKVRFRNKDFLEIEKTFEGIPAVAIQHEIDHLDGKLYIDSLGEMKRKLVVTKHKKFLKMRGRR